MAARLTKLKSWFNVDFLHHRIGLGFAGFGILLLLWTVFLAPSVASINCNRQASYYSVCMLTTRSTVGIPLGQQTLDPLKGAQVFPDPSTTGWTNRVMLYFSEGRERPFSRFSVTSSVAQQATRQINNFLGNPAVPSFRYSLLVPPMVFGTVLAGASIAVGLGILLLWIR